MSKTARSGGLSKRDRHCGQDVAIIIDQRNLDRIIAARRFDIAIDHPDPS